VLPMPSARYIPFVDFGVLNYPGYRDESTRMIAPDNLTRYERMYHISNQVSGIRSWRVIFGSMQ